MFINYEYCEAQFLIKFLPLFFLIFPIHAYAGFPEGEKGYKLKNRTVI